MSRGEQDSGLSDLLFGERWQTAAWRAMAVFVVAYILPLALMAATSRFAAFLKLLATVFTFVLTAGAVYRWLQSRAGEEWVPDEELAAAMADPAPVRVAPNGDVNAEAAPDHVANATKAVPPLVLETLGQAALERLCIALYQFNGLNSQTVATGAEGKYRIRLVPRNADKAIAILQCHAGNDVQDVQAYVALLCVMEEEGVEKAFFVAPAGFAEAVAAEARSRHVTLVDLKLLKAMLERLPDAARSAVFDAAA